VDVTRIKSAVGVTLRHDSTGDTDRPIITHVSPDFTSSCYQGGGDELPQCWVIRNRRSIFSSIHNEVCMTVLANNTI
jgi:hypothetical protein